MAQLDLPHLQLEYELYDPLAEARGDVVLIHGLGCQLIQWPMSIVEALREAGFRVLRFDNRDVGLSRLKDPARPVRHSSWDLLRWRLGACLPSVYRLQDMAEDTLALMDHLSMTQAHVIGVSMGGMIAQELAIRYPDRVQSLGLIMTTTGGRNVGGAKFSVVKSLMSPPRDKSPDGIVEHLKKQWRQLQGSAFPSSEEELELVARACHQRGLNGLGFMRQMQAGLNAADRSPRLKKVKHPALVVHGTDDPLIHVSGGKALAKVLPNARLELIKGWGHDWPEAVQPQLAGLLTEHVLAH